MPSSATRSSEPSTTATSPASCSEAGTGTPHYGKVEILGIHEHDDYDQDDRDADANKASFTITLDGKPHVLLLHNEHNGYYYHSFAWDAETHDGIEESGESEV